MKTLVVVALLGAFSLSVIATSSLAGSLTTEANGVRAQLMSTPDPPVTGRKTTYTIRLVDAAGTPLTDARVTLTGRMADGMSAATPLRPAGEAGVYRGEVLFTMGGAVGADHPGGEANRPRRDPAAGRRREATMRVEILTAPG